MSAIENAKKAMLQDGFLTRAKNWITGLFDARGDGISLSVQVRQTRLSVKATFRDGKVSRELFDCFFKLLDEFNTGRGQQAAEAPKADDSKKPAEAPAKPE